MNFKKLILLLILPIVIASCKARHKDNWPRTLAEQQPTNIDNICSIYREKPHWKHHIVTASNRWRIPPNLILAIIRHESAFVADAKNPKSSAFGYPQAIDATWDEYRNKTGNIGANRVRFSDAADFIGWYANNTRDRNKVSDFDTVGHYLAYHQGHTGFKNASYVGKSWLIEYANRVAYSAQVYGTQLQGSCR